MAASALGYSMERCTGAPLLSDALWLQSFTWFRYCWCGPWNLPQFPFVLTHLSPLLSNFAETTVAFAAASTALEGCGGNSRDLFSCVERTQRQGQARVCPARPFLFHCGGSVCPLPHPLAIRWLLGFLSLVPRQKSLYEEECFSLQPFIIKQKDLLLILPLASLFSTGPVFMQKNLENASLAISVYFMGTGHCWPGGKGSGMEQRWKWLPWIAT